MTVLIVNQREVKELLPMEEYIDVMEATLAPLSQRKAILRLLPVLMLSEKME